MYVHCVSKCRLLTIGNINLNYENYQIWLPMQVGIIIKPEKVNLMKSKLHLKVWWS